METKRNKRRKSSISLRFCWLFAAILLVSTSPGKCRAVSATSTTSLTVVQSFILNDFVDQPWNHDVVFFPLDKAPTVLERSRFSLRGPDGKPVPFQIKNEGAKARIAFFADLPSYGESRYQLVRQSPAVAPKTSAPPFIIEKKLGSLRISNGITGVEVPVTGGRYQNGPILSVRLKSGKWIGGSKLASKRTIESYETRIAAQGPVFVDIECRYHFSGGKQWNLDMRIVAGEPVVLIHEKFDLDDDSLWQFQMQQNFKPNNVLFRVAEDQKYSDVQLDYQGNNTQAQLVPWMAWWDRRNAMFLGLFQAPDGAKVIRNDEQKRLVVTAPEDDTTNNEAGNDDMLLAAAGDVANWARSGPDIYDNAQNKFVPITSAKDGRLAFQLQLAAPGRTWLLGTGSVEENLVADGEVAPVQKLMNRFIETPLDSVKDMPLRWQHTAEYPRLMLTNTEVKRLVASPDYEKILARSREALEVKSVLLPLIAGQPIAGNQARADAIKTDINTKLNSVMAYFRYGNNNTGGAMWGTIIPRVYLGYVIQPLDFALGAGIYTPAEKVRIFAQLAFIADKMNSPDYVSPGRSLTGNPNMVTAWSASLVFLACMMPDHPHAAAWYKEGMGRLDDMLDKWEGPTGAWLEAPHYMMAAFDPVFLAKIASANAGFTKSALDERVLRAITFLAKISSPPDPRFDNMRHFPPLGNTMLMETSMIFGATAKLYREHDPEKAAALQWMWQQQGRPRWDAIGGAFLLDYYSEFLLDESWMAAVPPWISEEIPGFGAVLHSGFPGDRETYMVYHQGDVAVSHYDFDQGSFEMWGKGRPLSLDWGYHGRAPSSEHNRMDVGEAGKVSQFAATPAVDYIHGKQDGGWDRQILLLKDADPLGPNYFVLRDSTVGAGKANWWLWLNARKQEEGAQKPVLIDGDVIHSSGEHDVDVDVWFAPSDPARLGAMEIKELTVATVRGVPGGSWGSWDDGKQTQQGLHVVQEMGKPLVSVLYPRLQNEALPQFASLADGKVIKVTNPRGVDYAFLATEPFDFKDGFVSFSGTAGAIQVRGKQVTCTLNAPGAVDYGKAHLASQGSESKIFGEF